MLLCFQIGNKKLNKSRFKTRRSRQSDVMSDLENMDLMLGNHRHENNQLQIEILKMKLTRGQIEKSKKCFIKITNSDLT